MVPILPVDFLFLYRPSGYRKEKKTLYVFTKGGWTTLSLSFHHVLPFLFRAAYTASVDMSLPRNAECISTRALSQTGDRLKENSWPISALFTQSLHTSTTRRPCSGLEKKKTLLLVFYTFWRALLLFLRNLAQCVYTLMDAKRVCHHFLAPPSSYMCVCHCPSTGRDGPANTTCATMEDKERGK